MRDPEVFVDASVFLGMHHQNDRIRQRSLAFFRDRFTHQVRMSFEQIGICDAVIWRQSRSIQDLYYPFMDRLHSEMCILRAGYEIGEIKPALRHPELQGLRPEQILLAGQVLHSQGTLATHDAALRRLGCLQARLWDFEQSLSATEFPSELQALYEASRVFVHTEED
jgi:hypothetical protein